jgi:hypothetical protein
MRQRRFDMRKILTTPSEASKAGVRRRRGKRVKGKGAKGKSGPHV